MKNLPSRILIPAIAITAGLGLCGCVSDSREVTIVEPTYSYLADPDALDALAAWSTDQPTLAAHDEPKPEVDIALLTPDE